MLPTFRSLIESPGDLMKNDIADDFEWPLEVTSDWLLQTVLLSVSQI